MERWTDAQLAMFTAANALEYEADLIAGKEMVELFLKRRRELRAFSALDLYAEDRGLCCRARITYGMNPDGTPWCDSCSSRFRWFNAVANYKPAGGDPSQPPQELRSRADRIRSSTVRSTRMVCKPCAEKNDDYDH